MRSKKSKEPSDSSLSLSPLAGISTSELFMCLLDYTKCRGTCVFFWFLFGLVSFDWPRLHGRTDVKICMVAHVPHVCVGAPLFFFFVLSFFFSPPRGPKHSFT